MDNYRLFINGYSDCSSCLDCSIYNQFQKTYIFQLFMEYSFFLFFIFEFKAMFLWNSKKMLINHGFSTNLPHFHANINQKLLVF